MKDSTAALWDGDIFGYLLGSPTSTVDPQKRLRELSTMPGIGGGQIRDCLDDMAARKRLKAQLSALPMAQRYLENWDKGHQYDQRPSRFRRPANNTVSPSYQE